MRQEQYCQRVHTLKMYRVWSKRNETLERNQFNEPATSFTLWRTMTNSSSKQLLKQLQHTNTEHHSSTLRMNTCQAYNTSYTNTIIHLLSVPGTRYSSSILSVYLPICPRLHFIKSWKRQLRVRPLSGWNSTLQGAWYIRHVRIIWFFWIKPTIWLLVSSTKYRSRVFNVLSLLRM